MTQMNISMKQTQRHRILVCQVEGEVGEGCSASLGLADTNWYIYIWISNKVLLCSIGNYIQYLVLNHNGKEYEKECIYV